MCSNVKAVKLTPTAGAAGLDVKNLLHCLPTQESNVKLDFKAAQDASVRRPPPFCSKPTCRCGSKVLAE